MESIYLKVTRDYTPSDKDARFGGKDSAITVEKGDIIFDVSKDDDGWLSGKNLNSGKSGRFPSDCVAKISDVNSDKDSSGSDSSPKTVQRKETLISKPLNRTQGNTKTKASEPKRTAEPIGLRRPPNPRPFGLTSRYQKTDDKEKKETSGDSGVAVDDEEDYYLNDKPPEKKKPPDSRKIPSESETPKRPTAYEPRFGNKTYSPVYSTRPSVSKLKSSFLDNDQKATRAPDMKGKEKPKDTIEMTEKTPLKTEPNGKNNKPGKAALATEDDDNDSMYASAEIAEQKPPDVNMNKKSDSPLEGKDKKVNIKDNPLSKDEAAPPYHSYQVPQSGPDKPVRGGCSECDEPHIYAAPAQDHYMEPPSTPEAASAKYDFDPTENQEKKQLTENPKDESKRRSYNRMASYESISNVGPDKKPTGKARSNESTKDVVKAAKKTRKQIISSDRYPRMRIIAGVLLGLLSGIFIFLLFFMVIPLAAITAIVAAIIIGLVFTIIFGFLDRKRLLCIFFLIFPSVFSTRGKVAIWILVVFFIIAGPLCNFIGNVNIVALSRGKCFVAFSGGNTTAGNNTNLTQAYPLYVRSIHPLLQRYIDTTRELKDLVNNTLANVQYADQNASRNESTPQAICLEFLLELKNKCMIIAKSEHQKCVVRAAKDDELRKTCEMLRPTNLCGSFTGPNIGGTCHNVDLRRCERLVAEISEVFAKAPDESALAAYGYGQQPVLLTPARQRCDNTVTVLSMLLPLIILLVFYEAYSYHKLYLSRNDFDNQYLTSHFKTIEDTRKSSGASDGLLPLKKCEHQKYIQPTSVQFTIAERDNMLKYLLVYLIVLLFALVFILGDYYLYYVTTEQTDGQDSQNNHVTNTTNSTSGAAARAVTCAPLVLPLEMYYVIVLSILLGLLLIMIVIQPYALRLRHFVASRMYRRRERKRIAFLYYKLLEERKTFFKTVIDNIHMESEENYAMDQLDAVKVLAWNFQTMETVFSILGVSLRNCMVCGRGLNRKYIYCETDTCESIYCHTCFYDLGNKCLGCMRDSNPLSRSSSFIQGSSRKRKIENTQGV